MTDFDDLLSDDDDEFDAIFDGDNDNYLGDAEGGSSTFLGMTPVERMFISIFLFLNVAVLGIALLLATGRIG